MARMSGTDVMMLATETPAWHFHVGGLTLIEADGDHRAMLHRIADEVEKRLPLAPKFMCKLRTVPFGLDRPVWVPDEDFDIRRHVHFVTLPAPAGRREVAALVGRIMSRQLDRRYPLWEMYLIDGLGNDRVATLMKSHHCMMDGVSGSSLAVLLNDTEPHPPHPLPLPTEPLAFDESPSRLSLLASAVPQLATTPLRLMRGGLGLAQRLGAISTFSTDDGDVYRFTGAPRTSFNGRIGPRRAFGFSSVALTDVQSLKEHFHVKVNDVVLALSAGALRNYLHSNGENVDGSLIAGVPVSTRGADTSMNNQIGNMAVKLATDIDDPVRRLQQIHGNALAAKALHREIRSHPIPSMGELAPPAALELLMRTLSSTHLITLLPTPFNTLISNVPGPPFDLYVAGGRVTGIFPTSVITETMALNITLFTYGGRMDFGVYVDPQAIPDPFLIAAGIPEALRELLDAAGLGEPTPVVDAFGEPSASPSRTREFTSAAG